MKALEVELYKVDTEALLPVAYNKRQDIYKI